MPVKSLEFVKQLLSSLIPWSSRQISRKKISTRSQYKTAVANLIIIDTQKTTGKIGKPKSKQGKARKIKWATLHYFCNCRGRKNKTSQSSAWGLQAELWAPVPPLEPICTMALSMQCHSAVPQCPHVPVSLSPAFPCLYHFLFQVALQAECSQTTWWTVVCKKTKWLLGLAV